MVSSLELRINSINDAKAAVSDLSGIHKRIKANGHDSVHIVISEHCVKQAQDILYGIFRVKTFTTVIPRSKTSVVYVPPAYCEKCLNSKVIQSHIKKAA